ncbi:MAG: radical SAM protein [Bacteroidales bacterium]|nr:radical SAM protein [Bacteroidales bacterium]
MLHFDDIVFGPIRSRRLGSSLGVNILPSKGKLCNFDCVYCECGWNRDGVSDRKFPTLAEVEEALESKISTLAADGVPVDSITFSGNGEPTVNPDFPEIIDVVLRLRDRFYPSAKVSVLSNATMLDRNEVFEALRKVDNPILKIDAPNDALVTMINKPQGSYSLENVVARMAEFKGDFVLQTMFLRSPDFDLGQTVEDWRDIVRRLKPRETMVYTIDRETPDKTLQKYTVEQMTEFVKPLQDEGYVIQIRG